jgi:multisubunit Na+/H+ antiporter MnhE subunit
MPELPLKPVLSWLITFGLLLGLWFLYTCTLNPSELLVGAGASALASTGVAVVEGRRFAQFSPRPQWFRLFLRMPAEVIRDTGLIWRAGVSALLGHMPEPQMQAIPFEAGGEDQRDSARRALATLLVTIPPNTIVVGIDRHENLALVHFLLPSRVPEVLKSLGANE